MHGFSVWYWRFRCACLAGVLTVTLAITAQGQEAIFSDDFSGDLSQWQVLGNPGNWWIEDENLVYELGFAESWLVTQDVFQFGSEPYRVDVAFAGGGHQVSANWKSVNLQVLLGATDPDADNGAVTTSLNYTTFSMLRRAINEDGDLVWQGIPLVTTEPPAPPFDPGVRVRIEVLPDGFTGIIFLNDEEAQRFIFQGDEPLHGGFGFRIVADRNVIVDDVKFSQIEEDGSETVLLEDDFSSNELGDGWVNESVSDPSDVAIDPIVADDGLSLINIGGDGWLRTDAQVDFVGKTTVFEYTFVDYLGPTVWNPSVVVGVKPFESGVTSGIILLDNGLGVNWGMENGGWVQGRAIEPGGIRDGMRARVVVDAEGYSGRVFRDDVQASRWFTLGPKLEGGIAFRNIVGRNALIDDVVVYAIEEDGSQTILFEDDFERDELGDDWVIETITPGGFEQALEVFVWEALGDGNGVMELFHDGSLDDTWVRLDREFPFGERVIVVEATFVETPGTPSIVIGAVPWVENETVGPILLDSLQNPWGMDSTGGNVWTQNGPVTGANIAITVNADGRSGAFWNDDFKIRDWEFEEGEAPIPVGAIGIRDPFDALQANAAPAIEPNAVLRIGEFSVSPLTETRITEWMLLD